MISSYSIPIGDSSVISGRGGELSCEYIFLPYILATRHRVYGNWHEALIVVPRGAMEYTKFPDS